MEFRIASLLFTTLFTICLGFSLEKTITSKICQPKFMWGSILYATSPPDDKKGSPSSWDDDVDYDEVWKETKQDKMPTSEWNDIADTSKLSNGKDNLSIPKEINELLVFDEQAASEIKEEARKIIEEQARKGRESIEKMKEELREDIESQRRAKQRSSQERAELATEALMNRIDARADAFLESTRDVRESTKRAAAADRNMKGRGLDLGSWGTLDNGAIVTMGGSMLGSVENAKKKDMKKSSDADDDTGSPAQNRVLIIADESSDQTAKRLVPIFCKRLREELMVEVEVIKPSQMMPLGGNDAACVIFFLTSFASNPQMDRLLKRTMNADGSISKPPTQFVGVSTLGTTRTNKMPYSMQNLLGGGKLSNRYDMEEYIRNKVINRLSNTMEPALDYTIVKFGDLKDNNNNFSFSPGDVLDGETSIDTAAQVLLQAVAFQPLARNSTLCATGTLQSSNIPNLLWEDSFLKLRGPELARYDDGDINSIPNDLFDQLAEYLKEWGQVLIKSKKLTTPAIYEPSLLGPNADLEGVAKRDGFKFVFKTTKTGANYLSGEEEKRAEKRGMNTKAPVRQKNNEGGVEVLIEITTEDQLRVRATRTNMEPKTVIKELSEASILRRLKESLDEFVKLYA